MFFFLYFIFGWDGSRSFGTFTEHHQRGCVLCFAFIFYFFSPPLLRVLVVLYYGYMVTKIII